MCGLAGEVRFDGRSADLAALERSCDAAGRRGARTAPGSGQRARWRWATAGCRSSTCRPPAHSPWSTPSSGLTVAFNGCIYNYQQLRPELIGLGHRFFSHSDTEVIGQGLRRVGHRLRRPFPRHVRLRHRRARQRPAGPGPGPPRHQAALPRPDRRRACASPRRCPRCWPPAAIDTSIDRTALAYYMTFHSVVPAPRTILNGVRKLPPATVRVVEADGRTA